MISVVLPVYRNPILLEYCLDHLTRRAPATAEIIVVDDASGSETREVLRRFGGVRLIAHEQNRGNTAAYNTGARNANGDVIVFVDSDVLVPNQGLQRFEDLLRADANVGAVGALLLYPHDYTIQHAGVAIDRWAVTHAYVGRPPAAIGFAPAEERVAVTAAFFACRRADYAAVGGFDETYRDGLEDIDFCLKLGAGGRPNILCSDVCAMHLESATRGPYKSIRRTYNYAIFFARWKALLRYDLDRYIERSAALLEWPYVPGEGVTVVNFCTSPSWPELALTVARRGLSVTATHNLGGFIAEHEPIDLFRAVPLAFHQLPSSLVFSVDHFSQLARNAHWFRQRPPGDLIVDRHANVVRPAVAAADA